MNHATVFLNPFRYLLLGIALMLAACGGTDSEPGVEEGDRLAKFEEQTIMWEACDPNLFDADLGEALTSVLGERLECATLITPLDWDDPERDEINLGVLRVKAGDPSQRKGAIFTNPGGPGADGLSIGALYGLILANGGTSSNPAAAPELLAQVSEQYDVIGFSPRGLGGSFQLFCGSNKIPPEEGYVGDRSQENVDALLAIARLTAEACKNNPLTDYVDTGQTVQDMDLVRRLLGDETLNYIGFSYGSWLGAWYAKAFPEHTGNMVLSANTDFSTTITDFFTLQPLGMQRAFEEVAVPYVARNNALFELGGTPEEVYGVYEALPDALKKLVAFGSPSFYDLLFVRERVVDIGVGLLAARGVNGVLQSFGQPLTEETAEAFLDEVAALSYVENEDIDAAASALGLALAEDYLADLFSSPSPITLEPEIATNRAVMCNDSPARDTESWVQLGDEQARAYPLIGGFSTVAFAPCAPSFWGEPTAEKPDLPDNLPPILMVQSGYDAPTPIEGALDAFESLPNAKFVYVENEMNHGVFPYGTECVDAAVAAYLLDGTLPEADISDCEALPLPGETQVYEPGSVPELGEASFSVQEALNPPVKNPLYDLLHEKLRENAADFYRSR